MNGVHLISHTQHVNVGIGLGALKFIAPHRGMDGVVYMDARFEHGRLQMTDDTLRDIVRTGQEALIPGAKVIPNCPVPLVDVGDGTDG